MASKGKLSLEWEPLVLYPCTEAPIYDLALLASRGKLSPLILKSFITVPSFPKHVFLLHLVTISRLEANPYTVSQGEQLLRLEQMIWSPIQSLANPNICCLTLLIQWEILFSTLVCCSIALQCVFFIVYHDHFYSYQFECCYFCQSKTECNNCNHFAERLS